MTAGEPRVNILLRGCVGFNISKLKNKQEPHLCVILSLSHRDMGPRNMHALFPRRGENWADHAGYRKGNPIPCSILYISILQASYIVPWAPCKWADHNGILSPPSSALQVA